MKKYFMPTLAVLLAIGFSAFTAPTSVKTKKTDTLMYWYFYDVYNDKLAGQIGDDQTTHQVAKTATSCDDIGMIECARGYDFEQNPFQETPGPGDDRVVDDLQ